MPTSRADSYASTAEAIRLALGVVLTDVHLAIGILLSDMAEGDRRFRTRRKLRKLTGLLRSDWEHADLDARIRDRSLATALPAFFYPGPHVMTTDDERARQDAELYRAIDAHVGLRDGVGLLLSDQSPADAEAAVRASVTVGSIDAFEAHAVLGPTALVRTGDHARRVARYRKVACLPDPVA